MPRSNRHLNPCSITNPLLFMHLSLLSIACSRFRHSPSALRISISMTLVSSAIPAGEVSSAPSRCISLHSYSDALFVISPARPPSAYLLRRNRHGLVFIINHSAKRLFQRQASNRLASPAPLRRSEIGDRLAQCLYSYTDMARPNGSELARPINIGIIKGGYKEFR